MKDGVYWGIMQMIQKKKVNGKTVITTKTTTRFWFWLKIKTREFEAQKESQAGYWEWFELPNRTLVPDMISIQLNAWNRL